MAIDPRIKTTSDFGANFEVPIGARRVQLFGRGLVSGTPMTLWPPATLYQRPTAPVQLEVVSSSAADNQAGAGARGIAFEILDAQMQRLPVFAPMHPTDGTIAFPIALPSSVAGVAPSPANTAWRAMVALVSPPVQVGVAAMGGVGTQYGSNLGDIEVRVAGGGATLCCIKAGAGQEQTLFYTTAADEVALIPPVRAHNNSSTFECNWSVHFQPGVGLDATPANAPWWPSLAPIDIRDAVRETVIGNVWSSMTEIPPLTDIEVRAVKSGGGQDIEAFLPATLWIKTVAAVTVPPVPVLP